MKKKIKACAWAALIGVPCILLLDGGPDAPQHETFGWTNLLGFAWLVFLAFGGFKLLVPLWMRREIETLFGEEEDEQWKSEAE